MNETTTTGGEIQQHRFTSLEGIALKRHLLDMADMLGHNIPIHDKDETHRLKFLRERVRRNLNLLKALQGPWEDTIVQMRQESATYLLHNSRNFGRNTRSRICNISHRRAVLANALMRDQTIIGCQTDYYVDLEKVIDKVLADRE